MKGMSVSRRSKESALARNGMLSSKAASSERRTTPTTDRCQPPSGLTRPARPPPGRRGAPRGGGASPSPPSGDARAPPGPTAPLGPRALSRPARRIPPRYRWRGRAIRAACGTASCGSLPPRGRTGTRAPPRSRRRTGTPQTRSRARSFARLQVVRSGHRHRAGPRMGLERRLDPAVDRAARVGDAQLLEQEGERVLEVPRDRRPHVRWEVPQAPLERPDRLLAALVDELLLGVALLPFVLALGPNPLVDLVAHIGRQLRVVEDDVLEVGREVDLDRLARREVPECLGREGRGAVLHRAAQPIPRARFAGQRLQRVEVELDLGDRAVGQHHAAMARPRLDGDFADPDVRPPPPSLYAALDPSPHSPYPSARPLPSPSL